MESECDEKVRLDADCLVTNAGISKDRTQGCIPSWARRRPAGQGPKRRISSTQGVGIRHAKHVRAKSDHDPPSRLQLPDFVPQAFDTQRGGLFWELR